VTDILEHKRNLRQTYFRTQKVIVIICQLGVGEMIPTTIHIQRKGTSTIGKHYLRARITVKQSGCLCQLFAILTPLTLESVMSVAECFFIECEQLAQGIQRKVAFRVFLFIDYG
jgi:hypothetical protein